MGQYFLTPQLEIMFVFRCRTPDVVESSIFVLNLSTGFYVSGQYSHRPETYVPEHWRRVFVTLVDAVGLPGARTETPSGLLTS